MNDKYVADGGREALCLKSQQTRHIAGGCHGIPQTLEFAVSDLNSLIPYMISQPNLMETNEISGQLGEILG